MTGMKLHHADNDAQAGLCELTPTQLKVLERVNSGLLNKQIAFDLGIAEATVKAHDRRDAQAERPQPDPGGDRGPDDDPEAESRRLAFKPAIKAVTTAPHLQRLASAHQS